MPYLIYRLRRLNSSLRSSDNAVWSDDKSNKSNAKKYHHFFEYVFPSICRAQQRRKTNHVSRRLCRQAFHAELQLPKQPRLSELSERQKTGRNGSEPKSKCRNLNFVLGLYHLSCHIRLCKTTAKTVQDVKCKAEPTKLLRKR